MQAAIIERLGGGPSFRELPRPIPGPGQILVRVGAAALNPVDLKISSGTHYGGIPEVPYIPGSEGVGVVAAAGSKLNGKRVRFQVASGGGGALAGWSAVDPATCLLLPDQLKTATAAALGVAGMAAWIPLVDKVQLQKGERVLILGATGPVGQIAVQIARLLGAGRIVAAARDTHALARTLDLGADAVVAIGGQSESALRD
jgi:NADPH:quinone reductase